MKDNKVYTRGISTETGGRFAKWFDNYWYHYKWHTIGIAFALIVVLVCTIQACSREKEDLVVVYAGRAGVTMAEENFEKLQDVLAIKMPRDFDGDGEKRVVIQRYDILNEEQIREIEATTDENGKPKQVSRDYIVSQKESYDSYLQFGESSVLLLDPWLYEALRDTDMLCPLNSVLTEVPGHALDGYGIRLGDTEWYQTYPSVQALPEDTVICLLQSFALIGKSSNEEAYLQEKEMFSALVEIPLQSEKS